MAQCAPRAVSPPVAPPRHPRGGLARKTINYSGYYWVVAPPLRQLARPGERTGSRSGARQLEEGRARCTALQLALATVLRLYNNYCSRTCNFLFCRSAFACDLLGRMKVSVRLSSCFHSTCERSRHTVAHILPNLAYREQARGVPSLGQNS